MESTPQLSTPEEELAYLREQVARKEAEISKTGTAEQATIISETIHEHRRAPAEILASEYRVSEATANSEAEAILAELNLGGGGDAIRSLQKTMEEKGIKNALSVMEKLNNPRIADDFHRYLIRYIAVGLPAADFDEKSPRFRALRMTLYEISLPEPKSDEPNARQKTLKELISGMEQFYAGLQSAGEPEAGEPAYYALELAVPADNPELQFYAAIPNSKRNLFEKQILAVFPDAHVSPQPYDYNVFADGGTSLESTARLAENPALPLKDYTDFDYDPLNVITNAFAKIDSKGEGAALQLIMEPRGERHVKHYRKILQALRKGEKHSAAFSTPETAFGEFARDVGKTIFSSKPKDAEKAKEAQMREAEANKT
ncbi:hypothetical protein HYT04_02460, partial [Candidatus Kaiserbacteria bacterium]|nr:hypothetical protein [Candidatus Kaiserbacteria bacterium]